MHVRRYNRALDQRGITVLEVLTTAWLAAILMLATTSLLKSMSRATKRAEESLVSQSGDIVGTRQVWYDLRRAGISFNFLPIEADMPPTSGFFDHVPDISCPPSDVACCQRRLTLTWPRNDEAQKYFVLAMSEGGLSRPTPLSPLSFYRVEGDGQPREMTVTRALAFDPEQFTNRLRAVMADADPEFDEETPRLLRFYSPITMRPPPGRRRRVLSEMAGGCYANVAGGGAVNTCINRNPLYNPPGMVSYVSPYVEGALEPQAFEWLPRQCHPAMDMEFDGIDSFFRTMPPVGGTSAFGMVMPIELVRYGVEPVNYEGRPTGQLVREVLAYSAGQGYTWQSKRVVAVPVRCARFCRKSLSTPSVNFQLVMDRKEWQEDEARNVARDPESGLRNSAWWRMCYERPCQEVEDEAG